MATYKTPDVYVEEISLFPPSVAEVETAIPAFIGYTEKATKISTGDLLNKPTRITSMLDFVEYYGGAPSNSFTEIKLDDSNSFTSVTQSTNFYLFDSLQLFYANGGGDCYIVSVGYYDGAGISLDDFKDGLEALEKYDEPTIILFPDAAKMSSDDLYGDLQQAALTQCNDLKDRVALFDLLEDDPNGDTFRDKVGINYLKYGMSYTPWLKVSLDKEISYRDMLGAAPTYTSKLKKSGVITLGSLATDTDTKDLISNLEKVISDVDVMAENLENDLLDSGTYESLTARYAELRGEYNAAASVEDKITAVQNIIQYLFDIAVSVDKWVKTGDADELDYSKLKTDIETKIATKLRTAYKNVRAYDFEAEDDGVITDYAALTVAVTPSNSNWRTSSGDAATNVFTAAPVSQDAIDDGLDEDKALDALMGLIDDEFEVINTAFYQLMDASSEYEVKLNETLYESMPVYRNIVKGINDSSTTMPPSGAIAGVIAATDRNRGVWKAPANVSLASVLGPATIFTQSELDALNIDVNAGKSINAIRSFTGKGTLVWGARTLAGNDNEWRYIPVRRFFNMVEESIKKSTYWAVFEPNNANTWVKVKGMIENYLTNKWREGALVGAKPDDAFFVKIGLGQTMTAQDVLNGYMYVEIGMAVVRPAEFIVLKFSHKLQQS